MKENIQDRDNKQKSKKTGGENAVYSALRVPTRRDHTRQ